MKRLFLILVLGLFLIGCTDEPGGITAIVEVKNETSSVVQIKSFKEGVLVDEISLNQNEKGLKCNYKDETFYGYALRWCEIDSIVFRFVNNNKGYISSVNHISEYDFPNDNTPFGNSEKYDKADNYYTYILDNYDYENAFQLPKE